MSIEVFFNKPVRPLPTKRIIDDILSAKKKIAVASAWFTDTEIAKAVINSPAVFKTLIVNKADINRGSRKAYAMLTEYFSEQYNKEALTKFQASNGIPEDEQGAIPLEWRDYPVAQITGLHTLGSDDWKEGVMHHKFVLVDQDIVWTGSFNLTYQARSNYENILRIVDSEVSSQYWTEVRDLTFEPYLFDTTQFAWTNGAFRCCECEKLYPVEQLGQDGGSSYTCKSCVRQGK